MRLFTATVALAFWMFSNFPATAHTIVVVMPTENDDRWPATREAINFWNQILADLELETRIEPPEVMINPSLQRPLENYARQVSQRWGRLPVGVVEPDSPEELRALNADIVVLLSRQTIMSFASYAQYARLNGATRWCPSMSLRMNWAMRWAYSTTKEHTRLCVAHVSR